MFDKVWSWAKEHPTLAAGGATVIVILLLYVLGFFGGRARSGSSDSATGGSYLSAALAQSQISAGLQARAKEADTALAIAKENNSSRNTVATDYFHFLEHADNNALNLGSLQSNNEAQVQMKLSSDNLAAVNTNAMIEGQAIASDYYLKHLALENVAAEDAYKHGEITQAQFTQFQDVVQKGLLAAQNAQYGYQIQRYQQTGG